MPLVISQPIVTLRAGSLPIRRVLEAGLSESTVTIQKLEIFRAGEYPQGKYSIAYLDQLIASYDPEKGHEAPITLDHAQEGPAYGWIARVWREGDGLFAEVRAVPVSLALAIKAGRYEKRSIEFYKDFEESGQPVIKAVTFLGASLPAVKGMAQVRLAEAGEGEVCTWSEASADPDLETKVETFFDDLRMMPEKDPFPGDHGVIVRQEHTGTILAHDHMAFLDDEGNGFTGPPMGFDGEDFTFDADGQIHRIIDGKVEKAGPVDHTHPLVLVQRMSEQDPETLPAVKPDEGKEPPKEDEPMPDPKEGNTPEPQKKVSTPTLEVMAERMEEMTLKQDAMADELRETKNELTAKSAEVTRMTEQLFQRDEKTRFDLVFDEAARKGQVAPADKADEWFTFSQLPRDDQKDVLTREFKDAEGMEQKRTPRQTALARLAARPEVVAMRELVKTQKEDVEANQPGGTGSREADDRKLDEDATAMMKENPKLTYIDAVLAVETANETKHGRS